MMKVDKLVYKTKHAINHHLCSYFSQYRPSYPERQAVQRKSPNAPSDTQVGLKLPEPKRDISHINQIKLLQMSLQKICIALLQYYLLSFSGQAQGEQSLIDPLTFP